MSYRHIAAARDVAGLDATAKAVLVLISTYSNKRGRAWCSVARLAEVSGQHRDTITRAVRRIDEITAVSVTRRPGTSHLFDLEPLIRPRGTRSLNRGDPAAWPRNNRLTSVNATPPRRAGAAASLGENRDVAPAATKREKEAAVIVIAGARATLLKARNR
jgi:hypothetical protein